VFSNTISAAGGGGGGGAGGPGGIGFPNEVYPCGFSHAIEAKVNRQISPKILSFLIFISFISFSSEERPLRSP